VKNSNVDTFFSGFASDKKIMRLLFRKELSSNSADLKSLHFVASV
jgi:hypothetical protein